MEASYYQNHQPPYQKSPCLSERRTDICPDIDRTNDLGYINSSPRIRPLHHSLSYPPASGRPLHGHEFQVARARSRLQTRSSPSTTGIISSSPELPQTTLSVSASSSSSSPTTTTLSSFPLPYRSQSATHYRSPSSEYPPATFLLTSQDFRPYHSPPTPTLPGRFSSPDDSRPSTSSAGLPNSYESESNPNTGSFSSPNWQPRDSKWPQSRSQSSRKYIPKGRRYDSPINQRRMAPRNGFIHPAKKGTLPGPNQAVERKVQDGRRTRVDELATRCNDDKTPTEGPRLVNHALPASLDNGEEERPPSTKETSMSVSRYVSPKDEEDSVQSIRNSQYWTQLKHDPIFSDLSTGSETISITDLKQRRNQILQTHAPSRQAIMKEQGTQTDPEEQLPFSRPRSPTKITATEQTRPEQFNSRPKSVPQSRKRPHAKDSNQHNRTSSLTDTDSPRIHSQQLEGRRGFKRSRSVTEEDYEENDYPHRRKVGSGISQDSFYSRRR
ncbi:hypothetical protein TMatcc_003217 [Talaromyces marneffei ATCC 18224]|uniref:uncharacterized protein n=1 Tax=Talaromyces marneffei TaxID=37727 RepID=UPI0012A88FBB|nr:uncharacterized protein EYB26_001718 [Talaromyces marneffei]KAE8555919.1 hypothetical protein EYB25_000617 [Talaromyces marneffei]QGA14065.1 hypothetical protein EYB26_001718 [Talaromyces marneffei]